MSAVTDYFLGEMINNLVFMLEKVKISHHTCVRILDQNRTSLLVALDLSHPSESRPVLIHMFEKGGKAE